MSFTHCVHSPVGLLVGQSASNTFCFLSSTCVLTNSESWCGNHHLEREQWGGIYKVARTSHLKSKVPCTCIPLGWATFVPSQKCTATHLPHELLMFNAHLLMGTQNSVDTALWRLSTWSISRNTSDVMINVFVCKHKHVLGAMHTQLCTCADANFSICMWRILQWTEWLLSSVPWFHMESTSERLWALMGA